MKKIILTLICYLTVYNLFSQKYIDYWYHQKNGLNQVKYYQENVYTGQGEYRRVLYTSNIPNGYAKYLDSNYNLRIEGKWKRGKEVGLWTSYHPNGKIVYSANYYDGKKDGEWKYFNDKGVLTSLEFYNKGTPIGKWFNNYDNGNIEFQLEYIGNSKYVISKRYYKNGKLKEKGKSSTKDEDDKVGDWEYYFEDGTLKEKGSYGITYFGDGEINEYKKVGEWKSYYNNGNLESLENYEELKKRGFVLEIVKSGVFKYYNKDGSPCVYRTHSYTIDPYLKENIEKREYFYKNGKTRIIITEGRDNMQAFDVNGNNADIIFFDKEWKITNEPYRAEFYRIYNSKKNGSNRIVRDYYLDTHSIQWEGCLNMVKSQNNSNEKKCEGENKYFYNIDKYHNYIKDKVVTSKVESIGFINKNGNHDGSWKRYYKNGVIKLEVIFNNGKQLSIKEYDYDGKLKNN
jgi:antitoxin component YwqK of YwqJK toxin-antitoxin module